MKMRELEARTGVNRETIRVYLRNGLVPEPARPKANVADYDDDHVTAIMAVRDLQRDSGLTLNQIKGALNGESSNRRVDAVAFQNLEALVATRVGLDERPVLLSALAEVWPHAHADALEFVQMGLVEILDTPTGPALSVTDSRILTIWQEMRAEGYTEANGFPPTIADFYKGPAEKIARQESLRFMSAVQGKMNDNEASALFHAGIRLMIDFVGLLRLKALMRFIHLEVRDPQSKPRTPKVKGPPR
jgi:DNA-binding transcriptional MerR regulator